MLCSKETFLYTSTTSSIELIDLYFFTLLRGMLIHIAALTKCFSADISDRFIPLEFEGDTVAEFFLQWRATLCHSYITNIVLWE